MNKQGMWRYQEISHSGKLSAPRTKGLELEEETHKSVSVRAGALEEGLGGSRGLEGPLSSETEGRYPLASLLPPLTDCCQCLPMVSNH